MAVNLDFFLNEAWRSMKRGGVMTLTALGIVFMSLLVLGIFLFILFNLNILIASVGDKLDVMAYVDVNYARSGAENLRTTLRQVPGVAVVEFVPKEAAWDEFKKGINTIDLSTIVENNPLPDAFRIKTKRIEQIPAVVKMIGAINGIDDVRYGGEIADRIQLFSNVIRVIGIGVIIFLVFATLAIVVNTIRLTVLARRSEIYIMRLVGATNSFVRWPYILEGMIIGGLGATGAALLLKTSYTLMAQRLQSLLLFLPIALDPLAINLVYLFVFVFGIFLGLIGAMLSVDQSLKMTQT